MNVLDIIPHPQFPERAALFKASYELVSIMSTDDERYSKRKLRGYTTRTCLFCGKGYPDARFSTYAHLLPQLIGNTNLYSDFECDECNQRFSAFEDDLAAYLGLSRSVHGLSGNKKAPGYKARRLSAKSRSFMGDNILIINPEDIETVEGRSVFRYMKNPYVPINVYKALLKSALSLMGQQAVQTDYKLALDCLNDKNRLLSGLSIARYQLSFNINLPLHVYHFRKRKREDRIHTDIFVFHFQSQIMAVPVPFHRNDLPLLKDDFHFIVPPPYFTNLQNMQIAMPQQDVRDFSSQAAVLDEEEALNIEMSAEAMQNSAFYNSVTGAIEKAPFNPSNIKYIILTKPGIEVDAKAFNDFIKSQMSDH